MVEPRKSVNREQHVQYAGMQAGRDVDRLLMKWQLIGAIVLSLAILGYAYKRGLDTGGPAIYFLIFPIGLFLNAARLWLMIRASSAIEGRMRVNDRAGRSNKGISFLVSFGFALFILFMSRSVFTSAMSWDPGASNETEAAFAVLIGGLAIATALSPFFEKKRDVDGYLPEEDEKRLAEAARKSRRRFMYLMIGIVVAAQVGSLLFVVYATPYLMHR